MTTLVTSYINTNADFVGYY